MFEKPAGRSNFEVFRAYERELEPQASVIFTDTPSKQNRKGLSSLELWVSAKKSPLQRERPFR
jgi:hypothetical protein